MQPQRYALSSKYEIKAAIHIKDFVMSVLLNAPVIIL